MRWTVVAAISVAFLLTAPQASRPKSSDPAPAARDVARYRALGHDTARSVAAIGAPLKTLTEEQMASVAALLVLTRVAAEGHLARSPEAVVLDEVWKELGDFCPPIKTVNLSRGGCIDADAGYAESMSRCLDEGKPEHVCEKLASPELSAAVACHMKELEALRGVIGAIPGRRWPPGPFPWPIESDPVRRNP